MLRPLRRHTDPLKRLAALIMSVGLLLFLTVQPITARDLFAPSSGLRVHFIDVGQGDSILIQSPNGTTALIDVGPNNGMALAYLRQQGIGMPPIPMLITSVG